MKGVLLDVGGVLVGPAGGRWNPRFDFESVAVRHLPNLDMTCFSMAVDAGDVWLASTPPPHSQTDYHRVVLAALGASDPTSGLLDELQGPPPGPVFEAYPETGAVLDRLKAAELRLAVVTDSSGNSDSKRRQLAEVCLDGYFDTIVVSDELGCVKPDPRMFDTASAALGLRRDECLFVDDVPSLVRAAIGLGYQGAAIIRDGSRSADVPAFDTLSGVIRHLGLD